MDHGDIDRVLAVVLTHRRPRLATQVVTSLIETEGISPEQIILVVNGEGGLCDPALEARLDLVTLDTNLGPAGGFRRGLERALERGGADWIYVLEDDLGLLELPSPRIANLLHRLEEYGESRIGAVVAYGRDLDKMTGRTRPHVISSTEIGFEDVDVAAWGASLVSRRVVEDGIFPDESWFFGYEDFDFFLNMKEAGYSVVVDTECRAVQDNLFFEGRQEMIAAERPRDLDEPWREYYRARNGFELSRRHGHAGWSVWQIVYSLRRMQLMETGVARKAYMRGMWDGIRGRSGINPAYVRSVGEWNTQGPSTRKLDTGETSE